MKENLDSWNNITNKWLNLWSESSNLAWKNWLVLMGITSTNDPIEPSNNSQLSTHSINSYLKQLIKLTEKSQQIHHWQSLQQLWLNLADILIHFEADDTHQKIAKFAHNLDNFVITEQTSQEELKKNHLPEHQLADLLAQIQLLKEQLSEKEQLINNNQTAVNPEKYNLLEQEYQKQSKTIEQKDYQIAQLKNQIAEKAQDNKLLKHKNNEQSQTIEQLNSQIAQLETLAAIGDKQLNKWRSRSF